MGPKDAKILIIDDEAEVRDSITLLFKSQSFKNTQAAKDAKTGLEKMQQEDFDLVIVDLMMPVVSGHHVLKEMKRLKTKTGVIVYSAIGLPEVFGQDLSKSYKGLVFLSKTVTPSVLVEHVKDALHKPAYTL